MVRYRFGQRDLLRTRFAIAPLMELVGAVYALRDPRRYSLHRPWAECEAAHGAPRPLPTRCCGSVRYSLLVGIHRTAAGRAACRGRGRAGPRAGDAARSSRRRDRAHLPTRGSAGRAPVHRRSQPSAPRARRPDAGLLGSSPGPLVAPPLGHARIRNRLAGAPPGRRRGRGGLHGAASDRDMGRRDLVRAPDEEGARRRGTGRSRAPARPCCIHLANRLAADGSTVGPGARLSPPWESPTSGRRMGDATRDWNPWWAVDAPGSCSSWSGRHPLWSSRNAWR